MSDRCPECDKPKATAADEDAAPPDTRPDLCWAGWWQRVCAGPPVDWRARAIEALAEVDRLRAVIIGEAERYENMDLECFAEPLRAAAKGVPRG